MHGKDWKRPGTMHELLFQLHILPVTYRVQYKIALLCHKCVMGSAPSYLSDLVSFQTPSIYNLRRNTDNYLLETLKKPHYKKTESAFCHIGPQTWNSLPLQIRSEHELPHFKTALKTHLFNNAFSEFV